MAQRVDPGDPAILAGINEVRDDNSPTDWFISLLKIEEFNI